jgi:hypothetical protein
MSKQNKNSKLQIRNSTAEFLPFAYQSKGDGVEVRVQDGTIWLSQKNMELLFETTTENVIQHIKNIFNTSPANSFSSFTTSTIWLTIQRVKSSSLNCLILSENNILAYF